MDDPVQTTALRQVTWLLASPRPLRVRIGHGDQGVTVEVQGTADAPAHARLQSVLSEIDLTDAPTITLQLAGLEFCDVNSARKIIDFAYDVRSHGGTIHVSEPPNTYVQVLFRILDAAGDLPQLTC